MFGFVHSILNQLRDPLTYMYIYIQMGMVLHQWIYTCIHKVQIYRYKKKLEITDMKIEIS